MKGIDLTALDALAAPQERSEDAGKPLQLRLSDIIEDPDQPRKHFDPVALRELADTIKVHGVKTPISVKPANADGKYVINHGARRFRASIMAGKITIPAHLDAEHNAFHQLIENIQRDDLTPMEIADSIQARIAEGHKPAEIAAAAGKDKTWVSRYQGIAKAAPVIRAVAPRCKDIMAMYSLVKAHEKHPAETEQYVATVGDSITRGDVDRFLDEMAGGRQEQTPKVEQTSSTNENAPPVEKQESAEQQQKVVQPSSSEKKQEGAAAPSASTKSSSNTSPSSATDLDGFYRRQAAGESIDAILNDLGDKEKETLGKGFLKLAKKGRTTTHKDFPSVLVAELRSGNFSTSGEGLYRMLAFLEGNRATDDLVAGDLPSIVLQRAAETFH